MIELARALLIVSGTFSATAQELNSEGLHAPIILEAFGADPMTIRARFVDTNTSESGYFLYYGTSPDGPFDIEDRDIYSGLDSGRIFTVQTNSGYEPNTLLYIKIAAFIFDPATGDYSPPGPFSELMFARTLPGWPPSPSNFLATAEDDHIRLTWTDNSPVGDPLDEAAWGIMRSNDGSNFNRSYVVPANTTFLVDNDVAPNTTYYYRLESINAFGNSFDVYSASATTLPEVDTTRLYGMTFMGGNFGAGSLYRINADGSDFTVLHNFTGDINGSNPSGSLSRGATGRVYGMTSFRGSSPDQWNDL
ncbi:MAG: hypothetical protein HC859_05695 [Bacteroidia bacterium]|nr:hypothetical protein [Bacteroidia bacterium]